MPSASTNLCPNPRTCRYAYLDGLLLSLCAAPRKSAKDTFAGSANVHRFPVNVACRLVRYQRANDGAGGSSSSSSGDSSYRDRSGSELGTETSSSSSGENKDHKGGKAAVAGDSEEAGGGRWEFSVESDSDSILMSAASEADRCVVYF